MVCAPYLWAREQLDELHTVSVKFFLDRRSHSVASLKNIACPVYLVHCAEDVAYSLEMSEEICAYMKTAGIDARVSQIADAPQIGCATHPEPCVWADLLVLKPCAKLRSFLVQGQQTFL